MIYFLSVAAALFGWVLLPFFSKKLGYFLVFTLPFCQIFFLLSDLNDAYLKFGAEILIVSLFIRRFISSLNQNGKVKFVGFKYLIFLLLTIFISALVNATSILEVALFTKTCIIYYLLFIALLNEDFTKATIQRYFYLFIGLFAVQLLAAAVKFSILGISEKGGVGTVSIASGSLSTVLPLFVCAYLIAFYIYNRDIKYIVLIGGFVLFAIIGHKRAIVFYFPLLFIITQVLESARNTSFIKLFKQKRFVLNVAQFIVLSIVLVYGIVRVSPALNPDNKIGGRFSFSYMMDFSTFYVTQNKADNAYALGRTEAPGLALQTVSNYGFSHIIFGMGPGDILESSLLPQNDERLLRKYGIGYGGRTGLIYIFMQVGLAGAFLFFMIPFKIYQRINDIFKKQDSTYIKALTLGCLSSIIVYFIDLFTYSPIMIHEGAIIGIFFAMPALIIQYQEAMENE